MKKLALAFIILATQCPGKEPQSAKTELGGHIIFSNDVFEDASTFKTAAEYKDKFKATNVLEMTPPETTFKYYASFGGPLGADKYYMQVYDLTTRSGKPVVSDISDVPSPLMSQVTGGWSFDIPEWPIPEGREVMEQIWTKPGHQYRVVILKPVAVGEFTVSGEVQPEPEPTE